MTFTTDERGNRHSTGDGKFANKDQATATAAFPSDTPDLSTWTPTDIDSLLADIYGRRQAAQSRLDSALKHLAAEIGRHSFGRGFRGTATRAEVEQVIDAANNTFEHERSWQQKQYIRHYEQAEELDILVEDLDREMEPLNAEFERRGGWTRAFLVSNQEGHVHSSMTCHTCRPTTRFHWITELSDHDESEIVEKAGQRACTSCYPSAPVDVLKRPTQLFTPDEVEAERQREERAHAKAEREADRIAKALTPDGSEFAVEWDEVRGGHERDHATGETTWSQKLRPQRERFKTERAATMWLVDSLAWRRDRPDELEQRNDAHEAIIRAIADKHLKTVDEVRAEVAKKVVAKRKRDGYPD